MSAFSHHSSSRGRRALAAAALAVALTLTAGVNAAQAHDPVTTTVPAEGAVITTVPEVFQITTAQPMLDLSGDGAGFGMQVTDADGLFYGDGCLTVSGATLSMPATLGAPGSYTMVFQYISSDGHTTSGVISFDYAPTDPNEAAVGSVSPPECGVVAETPSPVPSDEPTANPEASDSPASDDVTPEDGVTAQDGHAGEASTVWAVIGGIALALGLTATVIAVIAGRGRSRARAD